VALDQRTHALEHNRSRKDEQRPADQPHRPLLRPFAGLSVAIGEAPEHGAGGQHLEITVGAEGEQRQALGAQPAGDGDYALDDVVEGGEHEQRDRDPAKGVHGLSLSRAQAV
jgi:hypothetical protein